MEFIGAFLAQRWYVVLAALVALFLVLKLAKTILKWGIVLALLVGLVLYGSRFRDRLESIGSAVGTEWMDQAREQVSRAIDKEIGDARYEAHRNGSFTVRTRSLVLEGAPGAREVRATLGGRSFELQIDDTVKRLIERAKRNSGL